MGKKLHLDPNGIHASYRCPCGNIHSVGISGDHAWGWNGDIDRPTLSPSVLVRSGHHAPGYDGKHCWCAYNKDHPDDPAPFTCYICHSFVRDGRVEFLSDCTHSLAGQTVDLLDWEDA